MQLIVLWDIDHTLIDNAGVSKEIYAAAFVALTGAEPVEAARTEGRTDRLIMREMCRRNGIEEPEWARVAAALTHAGQQRAKELRQRGTALAGAREALEAVSRREEWVSSALTGNIATNAQMKLAAFGLDSHLDLSVGGYGADALERSDLVGVARERVRSAYQGAASAPVVLVGDTPRDVEAALTTGSHIVAVASGVHSRSELVAAGAEVVLPNLVDTAELLHRLERLAGTENVPGRPQPVR